MAKLMLGAREIIPAISSTKVESLNITPTTSPQVITPTGDTDAFNPINVSAVTSAIDSNIQAGNIRKGITILGVTGNVGSDGVIINREVSAQGVYQIPTSSFTFTLPSTATDVDSYCFEYSFYNCTGLIAVDLSSLTAVSGMEAMQYSFYSCTNLTSVDLSNLITISGSSGMQYSFQDCTSLTAIDLSSLTTISGPFGMQGTFRNCTNLTSVDLSGLTTLSGYRALDGTFQRCTSLNSLSFPALTSTSFGSYTNQFMYMLSEINGCTVHFPSNLQSVIGSWSDVTSGFGGLNTTILYDLPATS